MTQDKRYFKCDFDDGCGKTTLISEVKTKTKRVLLHCSKCGYTNVVDAPIALTNPNGSASFIGNIPGGRCL